MNSPHSLSLSRSHLDQAKIDQSLHSIRMVLKIVSDSVASCSLSIKDIPAYLVDVGNMQYVVLAIKTSPTASVLGHGLRR